LTRALTIRSRGGVFVVGHFQLTPTGLVVTGKPSFDEWQQCGDALVRMETASQWWLGDWLNAGAKRYHDKYDDAVAALPYERDTLKHYAYVARHVASCLRKHDVPYKVHEEVASLPPEQQRAILQRADEEGLTVRAVRELVRQQNHADKVAQIERGELPQGEYDLLSADPPWAYGNSGFDQSSAAHYPTLSVDAICGLPGTDATFPKPAHPSVLFLWATAPLLPDALTVMDAWGFTYKTCLVWIKDKGPSIGWWLDTRHELLLVGVRGAVTPLALPDSVIANVHPHEHSRKPDEAYALMEQMFPGVRKVECFARQPRAGWDVWGNEV
jgi:N6-adenosine-specific RNA methylase IME4